MRTHTTDSIMTTILFKHGAREYTACHRWFELESMIQIHAYVIGNSNGKNLSPLASIKSPIIKRVCCVTVFQRDSQHLMTESV
jgi:hypothetical protein